MSRLSAAERRARFGPSKGDRIRLGDTSLWLRVEDDRQAFGDEPIWGYAKNFRVGLAQSGTAGPSELDLVIVGAVVVDPLLGVLKADIGIKDGRIVGVGRAGNPATSDGIDLEVGPLTMT
ncbi:MAG TPA: urease subunit alpha, partial [Candidatus Limnocylindrales bacterium]|nr:urease subunit alpha [Candidatus Limnocylindrales bacterium]